MGQQSGQIIRSAQRQRARTRNGANLRSGCHTGARAHFPPSRKCTHSRSFDRNSRQPSARRASRRRRAHEAMKTMARRVLISWTLLPLQQATATTSSDRTLLFTKKNQGVLEYFASSPQPSPPPRRRNQRCVSPPKNGVQGLEGGRLQLVGRSESWTPAVIVQTLRR